MKKLLLAIATTCVAATCFAFPKALYVKSGDNFTKYNFGVAEDLKFTNGGQTLNITGYSESIDLTKIDYITFTAPVDNTALTPNDQKQKLVDIGHDLYNKINVNDQKELILMIDAFRDVAEYDLDEKYYDIYGSVRQFAKAAGNVAKGQFAASRGARARAAEIYKCEDFFGIFQADTKNHEWNRLSDADYLEFRFTGAKQENYTVKFESSAAHNDWAQSDFTVQLPTTMTITFSKNNTVLAKIEMNAACNDESKSFALFFKFNSNGYVVENNLKINNTHITDMTIVGVKGEELVRANAVIRGEKLTDIDNWEDEIENSTEDDEYWDDEKGEYVYIDGNLDDNIARHFYYAVADVDILGRLQVHGKLSSLAKLYSAINEDSYLGWQNRIESWNEDGTVLTIVDDDVDIVNNKVAHLNNYSDVSFRYDYGTKIQGYFAWELNEDTDEYMSGGYWDSEKDEWVEKDFLEVWKYYEIMPVLVFPDLTTFAIEDYFENGFSKLVDDYDDIVDTYESIVK